MMIVESEASSIVLETLIDEVRVSVLSGIERMHMITQSMCQDVLNSMRNWDERLVRSVEPLEDDVDQLMFLLLRLIRSSATTPSLANQQGLDLLDCLDHQTLVHRIERVADHSASIANSIITLIESKIIIPEKVMSTVIRAGESAFASYDNAVKCYLSRDTGPTNDIIDNQKQIEDLYSEITPLPNFGSPNETSTLSHIINIRECIVKISHLAADIAELTIDQGYKSDNQYS
jgi:phosphate uptake regulator